jgi:hypothetical protein
MLETRPQEEASRTAELEELRRTIADIQVRMYVCMYVRMYGCVFLCVYIYIYIYIYIVAFQAASTVYIHTRTHTCICAVGNGRVSSTPQQRAIHTYTYIIHTQIHVHMRSHASTACNTHVYIHNTYTDTRTYAQPRLNSVQYTCIHTHTHTHVHMRSLRGTLFRHASTVVQAMQYSAVYWKI